MLAQALLLLSSVVGLATTQSIDPDSVPIATRDQWCQSQQISCPLICLQLPNTTDSTESNSCEASSLSFSCVCSNGQSPNASEYTQTIPYFVCTEAANQCVTNCQGDSTCQAACRDDHPCGAQNPKRVNTSTITTTTATATSGSSASGTSSGDIIYTGFGSTATASADKGGAASNMNMVVEIGQIYGLFMILAGLMGGFAIFL